MYAGTRAAELAAVSWSDEEKAEFVQMQFAAQAQLHTLGVTTVPVDPDQVVAAREGFRKYGKGRHEAGVSFGDCFAYSLAITLDAPPLFKEADFAKTDVRNALE